MKQILASFVFLFPALLFAQIPHEHPHNRAIEFPDVEGYRTLIVDFHQHTVFSDGSVWPNIRVQEALRDSVDAISLTEHIEYQPHAKDLPHEDRNRAFELASQMAKPYDLIVVNGTEITREMPPGHTNAVFIQDANKLKMEDPMEVFKEANNQGAFLFWNHPNWIAQYRDGVAKLTDMHKQLIGNGLLHGIEVVNDVTYSDEALKIALDYNLTIMGTSDIHGLVDWQYEIPEGGHRPVTLVFAKERTAEAIREGLFEKRTVVWFKNSLIAREREMDALLEACIEVDKAVYQGIASVIDVTLKNNSDVEFILANKSEFSLHDNTGVIMVHSNTTTTFSVKTLEQKTAFDLKFQVLNAVTAPNVHPEITLNVKAK